MYQLSFYVPLESAQTVKDAIFATGAGSQGNYSKCAWQVLGEGQFQPNAQAKPFLGTQNQLEKVAEYKIEILCTSDNIASAVAALKKSHPYEEVAFNVIKLADF